MAIYVTGDLHGTQEIEKLKKEAFPEGQLLTKDDFLIILGDVGLVWAPLVGKDTHEHWLQMVSKSKPATRIAATEQEGFWLGFLSDQPYTTLFIDGNHENFDRLLACPVQDFHGGKASQVHDTVWYLRRGEVFDLCGKTCFVMGGAQSIDMMWRTPGANWWPEEVPSHADFRNAQKNLDRHKDTVDFVFTHTCPESVKRQLPLGNEWAEMAEKMKFVDRTEGMLEGFLARLDFARWYFAHFHLDHEVNERFVAVFRSVLRIA